MSVDRPGTAPHPSSPEPPGGRYRGLLLDFNGVLTTDLFAAYREFCRTEGLSERALVELLTRDPEGHRTLTDLECGRIEQPQFEELIGRRLGIDGTRMVERVMEHLDQDAQLMEFAQRARRAGVRTAVLSNSLGMRPYDPYAAWHLPERFDAVVLSGEVGLRKPDPEIYALGAARLDLPPSACVLVDDLEPNLAPARALGMAVVHHTQSALTIKELERLPGLSAPV